MDSSNHVRCQPAFRSLPWDGNHLASQDDWLRTGSWDEKWNSKRGLYLEEVRRHKARRSSESGVSYAESHTPPATQAAHSIPTPQLCTKSDLLKEASQLPMSKTTPDLSLRFERYPDCIDPIANDDLPLTGVTREQATWPDLQLSPFDKDTTLPTISHISNYPPMEGPLERYLAQDDYVPNVDGSQGVHEALLRLRSLRANALQLRSVLRTKRKLLLDKQTEKVTADEAFMRFVREHITILVNAACSEKVDTLYELFKAMQDARDEYGPFQNDCDETERSLDDTEFEMGVIEGRIHKKDPNSTPLTPSQDERKSSGDEVLRLSPSSFLNFGLDYRNEYHPLHSQYLSRLGDLDLASERLHTLGNEYHELLSSRESRLLVGLDLEENLQALLAALPEQQLKLQEEIIEIEKDVDRLYSDCLAAGIEVDNVDDADDLSTKYEYKSEEGAGESDDILAGNPSAQTEASSSQSRFALLHPRSEYVLGGKQHAISIDPASAHLSTHPTLHIKRSAPGLLKDPEMPSRDEEEFL